MPLAVLADISRAEPLRENEVYLESAALPVATDCIGEHIFELRPIECALAGIELNLIASGSGRLHKRRLRLIPHRIRTRALRRPVRKFYAKRLKAEIAIDRGEQGAEVDPLLRDLILAAEDVRVVLHETAD